MQSGLAYAAVEFGQEAPVPRILLVEDEPQAAGILAIGLREQGYSVDIAADGEQALASARATPYDLVILDVILPGRDGFEVCRELRHSGLDMPVLMVTARDAVPDRVAGLEHGADDYITKPFEYGELLARVRASLRRRDSAFLEEIRVGDLVVDLRARRVERAGAAVDLSAKEYAVLEYMALRAGELVTREDLSEHVWDESFNSFTNLVEVYMLRLRRKIDSGHAVKLIRTRRGEGYMLSAEPRR
jgi:two-component system copper resistance phosphate regulon response regulator CusR